jgi:hypothetical protein
MRAYRHLPPPKYTSGNRQAALLTCPQCCKTMTPREKLYVCQLCRQFVIVFAVTESRSFSISLSQRTERFSFTKTPPI